MCIKRRIANIIVRKRNLTHGAFDSFISVWFCLFILFHLWVIATWKLGLPNPHPTSMKRLSVDRPVYSVELFVTESSLPALLVGGVVERRRRRRVDSDRYNVVRKSRSVVQPKPTTSDDEERLLLLPSMPSGWDDDMPQRGLLECVTDVGQILTHIPPKIMIPIFVLPKLFVHTPPKQNFRDKSLFIHTWIKGI